MRMSSLFSRTLREAPAEAETPSHRLLLRAGLIAPLAAGVYSFLPLGFRVLRKIEQVIREEMDAEGAQELLMPEIHPIEIWRRSGRDQTMKDILFTFRDKRDREFVLGPTHEEIVVELFKRVVQSYRDLPALVYQVQTKFRDEPRPRGGLIRLRQFTMKDLYSLDADWEGLDAAYEKMHGAYKRVFDRCGVPTVPVTADTGAMGGRDSHEFMFLTDEGEDSCLLCPGCGYAANAEAAGFVKEPAHAEEEPKPVEEIDTPGLKTIEELARFLDVPESRTCKAVFYSAAFPDESARDGVRTAAVFVAIRGDMDVNEAKLRKELGTVDVAPMDEETVRKAGFVAGSAGAMGLSGVRIVADELVTRERNLVAGANKQDKHVLNTNYGRDWKADIVADIALAQAGHLCAQCREPMDVRRGIEMGHIFKLGTGYAEKLGATFLDSDGKQQPVVMGSYGIGLERLLAAVVEANRDDNGVIWPRALAPFDVHVVAIQVESDEIRETAEKLCSDLEDAGLSVLFDDREESPGVKFKDADLLGLPVRVTVSPRNMDKGSLELKLRAGGEGELVPVAESADRIRQLLESS